MKRIFISFFSLLLTIPEFAYAEKITTEKALQVASVLLCKTKTDNNFTIHTSEDIISSVTKNSESSFPYYYIVSRKHDKGFAIISASDYAMPVLGYSLDSEFDINSIPDNMVYWFKYLEGQIKWAQDNNITDSEVQHAWSNLKATSNVVKYIETASWGQKNPFYLQCPQNNGTPCVTGCAATAIAEVMRYYQWPNNAKGVLRGYKCKDDDGTEIYVPIRSLGHSYNWDNMPLSYTDVSDTDKKNEVATLMADIGTALQLNYGLKSTSGYPLNECLINNFKYSKDLRNEYKDQYSSSGWNNLLKSELDQNRPLVYVGYDVNGKGGHVFVIDGYDEDEYFHINWGWNGKNNGYYLINALNPAEYKFNNYQNALINLYPDNGSSGHQELWLNLCDGGIECSAIEFLRNVPFCIDYTIMINNSALSYSGIVGMMLTDETGEIIETLQTHTITELTSMDSYISSWKGTITQDIKPGFRIRFFHKPEGHENWYPLFKENASTDIIQELIVGTNTLDIKIGKYGHTSIFSASNLIVPPGVEVFTCTYDSFSSSLIPETYFAAGEIIPAQTGCIVKGNAGSYQFTITDKISEKGRGDLLGTIQNINKPSGKVYVLGTKFGDVSFYLYTGSVIPAGKIYFIKPD